MEREELASYVRQSLHRLVERQVFTVSVLPQPRCNMCTHSADTVEMLRNVFQDLGVFAELPEAAYLGSIVGTRDGDETPRCENNLPFEEF